MAREPAKTAMRLHVACHGVGCGLALTGADERNNIVDTMQAITVTLRSIGNSKGVVLPKPVLAQAGLEGAANVSMTIENGAIVLRGPTRAGWAAAARALAEQGADDLVMGEFGNQDDAELTW